MINQRVSFLLPLLLVFVVDLGVAQDVQHSRGSEVLMQYKQGLQKALGAGLEHGVVEAITACRIQAPEIAVNLSQNGVRVGRSSHRLRNPSNTAPGWVEPIMNAYVANTADRMPREVALAEGRSGYVEPIFLQPVCVACHGDVLANDVATRISDLYPEDHAVGFKVGDLRGVFWIEYPAE